MIVKTALKFTSLFVFFTAFTKLAFAGITPPLTTLVQTPSLPNGKNDWYVTPVNILLSSTDLESGVATINYKINEGSWITVAKSNTLNLAPNPSFETEHAGSSINTLSWETSLQDANVTYSRDTFERVLGTTSIKINSTGSSWHSINHSAEYSVANPLSNMSAEVWMKGWSVSGSAYFKIFAVSLDLEGNPTYTLLTQSSSITGTTEWMKITKNFIVNVDDAVGVYMEVGLEGTGVLYIDGVSINNALKSADTTFTVSADGNYTIQYYATDRANNSEAIKSISFKLDQTPPSNWRDSSAFRGVAGPSDHHLYVTTTVDDPTSGLSTLTDKYQYHTTKNPTFGYYSDLMRCNSTWMISGWAPLISSPFVDGATTATLLTPKTDFCDSVWKVCKTVRFYAEDMAGNYAYKDLCINGPWIRLRNGGIAGSLAGIDMLSETDQKNTDSVIELGNAEISFFTSTENWVVKNNPAFDIPTYSNLMGLTTAQTEMLTSLPLTDGIYIKNGNLVLSATTIPNSYATSTFKQIIFVNGNLRFDRDLRLATNSAVLFVVSGDVEVRKNVEEISAAIVSEGTFYTAYDTVEGEQSRTLNLNGVFIAGKFIFQRTLQGTNNLDVPSEDFTFDPKFGNLLKDFIGINGVQWIKTD